MIGLVSMKSLQESVLSYSNECSDNYHHGMYDSTMLVNCSVMSHQDETSCSSALVNSFENYDAAVAADGGAEAVGVDEDFAYHTHS
jgi:hypothetical protein